MMMIITIIMIIIIIIMGTSIFPVLFLQGYSVLSKSLMVGIAILIYR